MKGIDSGVPILKMSIIGTHNSVVFGSCSSITGSTQQCQANALDIQLKSGIRAIDIHVKHFSDNFQIYDRGCIQNTNFDTVLTILN